MSQQKNLLRSQTVVSRGLDWLTLIYCRTELDPIELHGWLGACTSFHNDDPRPWRFFGYDGLIAGNIAYGWREDEVLIQLRSSTANDLWHTIPAGARCTRLDLQVTVLLEEPFQLASSYFTLLGGKETRSKLKKTLIQSNNDEGGTLYLGSRKSLQMGRIYDKGSKRAGIKIDDVDPAQLWRYEVELKKERAKEVYTYLRSVETDPVDVALTFVFDWFTMRGVTPLFADTGENLDIIRDVEEVFRGDRWLKRIAWLKQSVRPAVRELIDAGYLEEVARAMGFGEAELYQVMSILHEQD